MGRGGAWWRAASNALGCPPACAVAPACALCLLPPWLWWEGRPLLHHRMAPLHHVGAPLLLLNASVVVLLNLSTMALIKHTSALTLNVSGVFKDIGAPRTRARPPAHTHAHAHAHAHAHTHAHARARARLLTAVHARLPPRRRRRVPQA